MALIPYCPGTTFAVKLPSRSVLASLTVFTPSRTNDTTAPASGFPLLSLTVPVIVASDLLEPASASFEMNEISASRDNPKPNALLMRKDLRDQSTFGSHGKAKLVQARRLTGTKNREALSSRP